jgi:hypothetical protein
MKPASAGNNKNFQFQQQRKDLPDADYCMELLLQGNIEEFRTYVAHFPYVVNMKDGDHGNVPLHVASSKGDLGLMNYLLQNGAEVNIQDIFGNSPLHYAADKGKRSAVELLIQAGANSNLQDFRGNAPLHLACANNDIDTVKLLLKFNADPEITDLNDMKPGDRSNSPMIKILLDRRVNSIRTGEADTAQQSVQWMSLGVGLGKFLFEMLFSCAYYVFTGVGLGVALAKYQQVMMEQQIKAQLDASKPKRRGNFPSNNQDSAINLGGGSSNVVVPYQDSSLVHQPSRQSANLQEGSTPQSRKFF